MAGVKGQMSGYSMFIKKSLADEKGIALIVSIVILAVLAVLGAAAILTSQTDRDIADNETIGLQAVYAAEAGLSMAIYELSLSTGPDGLIEDADSVSWGEDDNWFNNIPASSVSLTGADNESPFFDVSVRVEYKRDGDEPCAGRVVFYNRDCGFDLSPFQSGGFPVYLISSLAVRDNFSSKVKMELTRQVFDINIEGAFTANGPVNLGGHITVDGRRHDINGGAGGVCDYADLEADETGVYSELKTGGGDLFGSPAFEDDPGTPSAPSTPWNVLGISGPEFERFFTQPVSERRADGTLSGYTWVQGGFGTESPAGGNDIGGSGILVVHNPDFEADKWEKWNVDARYRINGCLGVDSGDEAWCADYNADASNYEPARLGNITRGTFRGLVIADRIDRLGGTAVIIGAVVSMTATEVSETGGAAEILFSCDALKNFTGGMVNRKLSWQKAY